MGDPTLTWAAVLDDVVRRNGSLAATAELLAAERHHKENVDSIERALRRLRNAHGNGGLWGARVLERFGLPSALEARMRWMGSYHSRFTDLPTPIAADLLRHWDTVLARTPPAVAHLDVGWATLHLRRKEPEEAASALQRAFAWGTRLPASARVEALLADSFRTSRTAPEHSSTTLDRAGEALAALPVSPDRANLHARWVDQCAYRLTRPARGSADPAGAYALFETIDSTGPAFARCRRHNGLGWTSHLLGRREVALGHARNSVEIAGDAGLLRIRAMALNLLARVATGDEATRARQRATSIATLLEDELLIQRYAPPVSVIREP